MAEKGKELTAEEKRKLLEEYTKSVTSGDQADKRAAEKRAEEERKAGKRQFSDEEAERDAVVRPKQAGQPSSKMPFAHGKVFSGQDQDA